MISSPVSKTTTAQPVSPAAGVDYLANYPEWVVLQSGLPPYRDPVFDPSPRYIVNGRMLAEWVHYDFLYQAYHFAAFAVCWGG